MTRKYFLPHRIFLCFLIAFLSLNSASVFAVENPDITKKDSVIKILAIGNSFSQDAIEYYLDDLARAANIKVVIGNMYIGGASLAKHWEMAQGDKPSYAYRKIDTTGVKTDHKKTSLKEALQDEDWDFISFQQASTYSGQYKTFKETLPDLFKYVQEHVKNPDVKYVLHQTWAYEQSSSHKGFANYNNDQLTMYKAIARTYRKAMKLEDFDRLIPAGTAIQNGRTSFVGDNFCRDGYHLDPLIGRYTASCAWFEALFEQSVVGNSFIPEGLSPEKAKVAQQAAHQAALRRYRITPFKSQ